MSAKTKKCSACKKRVPKARFDKNHKAPDGLQYQCRPCQNKYRRRRYQRIRAAEVTGLLECTDCGKHKHHSKFGAGNRSNGKHSYCRACANRRARQDRRSIKGAAQQLVVRARARAKRRGMTFDLDPARVRAVLEAGRCEATGLPFDLSDTSDAFSPSLDRKDSSEGYTEENTWVVIVAFNVAKNRWPTEQLVEIVKAYERTCRSKKN